VVLAPVYFSCPNICGVTLDGLALALSQMPLDLGRDYRLVAYSLHPGDTPADARETRARLRRILGLENGAAGAFLTLADGEEPTSARRVGDALGFRYAWDDTIQQYAHAAGVFVLASDGSVARWLSGVRFQPTDLRLALLAADDGRIADPAGRALMLCYRYDAETGTYTPLIENALRVFGGATAFTLGGFIAVALWRERRRRP
jgi:protein SCO1/2